MDTILKWALKNAVDHDGKAMSKAVIPKVIGEKPELRKQMKGLVKKINQAVEKVNSMEEKEQRKKLEKMAPELLKQKEEKFPELPNVKNKVVMRMAPYPSGPLHIGNARMVILNDEYVKKYGGKLLLVIDDTIGSKQKKPIKKADKWIKDGLDWLGVDYSKTIYKSDRMHLFYEKAEDMIKRGFAYVCECPAKELRKNRKKSIECIHRNQSQKNNLLKWKKMLSGEYEEGEAVVRLKTDMNHKNPAFRDRVLLRISESNHPRVGNEYHVWPMLEFSWAVDDFELGITHVLRGKDLIIEDDMENYIWDLYNVRKRPEFIHYGLLSINTGFPLSKTKARKKIQKGEYTGWDDPRTWSLQSLKRRGIQPEAIRQFIKELGMSLSDVTVPTEILYSKNRSIIDKKAERRFFIKDPVKINVLEGPNNLVAKVPKHPDKRDFRKFEFQKLEVLIERDDFASLKKEKNVRLKDMANIKFSDNSVKYAKDQEEVYDIKKIHWLPTKNNIDAEILMPNGEWVKGIVEQECRSLKKEEIIQFERFGFCRLESTKPLRFVYAHK